jgi:N-acetylmuramoyl-L-alanine amidase CwlA
MVKIEKNITSNPNRYYGRNPCNYITIHQTGNTNRGADARMHGKYIDNGAPVTWHFTVDDKRAVQHLNTRVQGWHAGSGKGNRESIGVELCVNSDGDYIKTIENAVELVKKLMYDHNIPASQVVQHNYWSGKDCPRQIRDGKGGITWGKFISMVSGSKVTQVSKETAVTTDSVDIDQLVKDTLAGKYGNGDERKRKLGKHYSEVQRRINNQILGSSSTVNYDKLVNDTLKGLYGNGAERKRRLGKHYDEVQKRINRIYKNR